MSNPQMLRVQNRQSERRGVGKSQVSEKKTVSFQKQHGSQDSFEFHGFEAGREPHAGPATPRIRYATLLHR